MIDNTEWIKAQSQAELQCLTPHHHHCWHSKPGKFSERWKCCGCPETGAKVLLDYYVEGSRLSQRGERTSI